MIQPATNSLGQILTDDFGFAKFSDALKASGKCGYLLIGDDSSFKRNLKQELYNGHLLIIMENTIG